MLCGVAVSEGVAVGWEPGPRAKQPVRLLEDEVSVGANQPRIARVDRFHPLGRRAEDQHRYPETGCLLLEATGVGEYQSRLVERTDQVGVVQRVGDVYP